MASCWVVLLKVVIETSSSEFGGLGAVVDIAIGFFERVRFT